MDEALHDKVAHAQPKPQVIIDPVSGARGPSGTPASKGAPISLERYPSGRASLDRSGAHRRTCTGAVDHEGALRIYAEDWFELVGAYTEEVSLNP